MDDKKTEVIEVGSIPVVIFTHVGNQLGITVTSSVTTLISSAVNFAISGKVDGAAGGYSPETRYSNAGDREVLWETAMFLQRSGDFTEPERARCVKHIFRSASEVENSNIAVRI